MVPYLAFAAETASDKWGDDLNVFRLETKYVSKSMGGLVDGLGGIENRQATVIIPNGNRRVWFDGVVVVTRCPVDVVDTCFGLFDSLIDITDCDFRRLAHDIRWHHSS